MKRVNLKAVLVAAGIMLCPSCFAGGLNTSGATASGSSESGSSELVLDIASALQVDTTQPTTETPLSWIYMEASGSSTNLNQREEQPRFISPRELLNRVSVGAWKWENGTQLRVSGDRVRLTYGEKIRFNLTVKPFRNSDTISVTVNSSF